MILNKILKESANKYSDKIATSMKIGFRTKNLSYKQIYDLSKKIALFLQSHGINKGDKVLIISHNSPYWISVFWGTLLRGAIIVPLNVQSTKEIIRKVAEQTEAKILFKSFLLKNELGNIKQFDIDFIEDLVCNFDLKNFKSIEINEDDIFQIMYTSGTTGEPKGVIHTHKNVFSNLEAISEIIIVNPNKDKVLSILPLSHIYEQTMGFLLPFWHGVQIIYLHSYGAIRSLMNEYQITKMVVVPEFLNVMLSRIELEFEQKNKKNLFDTLINISTKINNRFISRILFFPILRKLSKRLDTIASGGAPLNPEIEKKWQAFGIRVLQGYGLTETSPVVATNTFKEKKIGSVGKPISNVQIKISNDNEILVKGPNVFYGYYKNPQKTEEVFTNDSWFMTGDLGQFDEDGFLFIKGRKKYMIKSSGGQNVYPEDIEQELNKNPEVIDSCVLGIEKSSGAVEIHAVLLIDKNSNLDTQKIIDRTNAHLASYQQIHSWSIWPEIDFPRTVTRKIKKEEVRKFIEKKSLQASVVTDKKTKLMQIVAQVTNTDINQISEETKIVSELHLDSLMRIELITAIEESFGVLINETDINQKTTIKDLQEIIQSKKPVTQLQKLKRWPRNFLIIILRIFLQEIFFLLMRIFVKLKVEGKENLKNSSTPLIFMPNHLSYIDSAIVAMAIPLRFRIKLSFAAARDVLYQDFKHLALFAELLFNSFPIQRKENENIKLGLEHIGQMLDQNFSVVLFPEGKMSESGDLQNFQKGVGLIATEMDSCVVPMKLIGTNDILPYGKVFPKKRGIVTVRFGKPIKFKRSDSHILAIEKIYESLKNL